MDDKKRAQLETIRRLARQYNIEILAHYYQRAEVKRAADFVGGSREVVARALDSPAAAVLVCGASFMTEEILRRGGPKGRLLVPRDDLSCPLSEAVSLAEAQKAKQLYPESLLAADFRASRQIKEAADILINPDDAAEKLGASGQRPLIVLPGPHLADQIGFGARVVNRWPGAVCQVHELALAEELAAARQKWPQALAVAHSLCRADLLSLADFVGEASAIFRFCAQSSAREFIIVSEAGLIEYLAEELPDKIFHETEAEIFCPNMKLTNLKSIITRLKLYSGGADPRTSP